MKQYYVYLMANRAKTLYVGVTSDLERRVYEHKHMVKDGFTRRYLVDRLLYYEVTADVSSAIAREKEIKGWRRSKKVALVESRNPQWQDSASDFADRRPAGILRRSPLHTTAPRAPQNDTDGGGAG